MSGKRWHPSQCKVCDRRVEEVGSISATGLCPEHSVERFESNLHDLYYHSGPGFEHWRRRMAAAVGAVLVDDG